MAYSNNIRVGQGQNKNKTPRETLKMILFCKEKNQNFAENISAEVFPPMIILNFNVAPP